MALDSAEKDLGVVDTGRVIGIGQHENIGVRRMGDGGGDQVPGRQRLQRGSETQQGQAKKQRTWISGEKQLLKRGAMVNNDKGHRKAKEDKDRTLSAGFFTTSLLVMITR